MLVLHVPDKNTCAFKLLSYPEVSWKTLSALRQSYSARKGPRSEAQLRTRLHIDFRDRYAQGNTNEWSIVIVPCKIKETSTVAAAQSLYRSEGDPRSCSLVACITCKEPRTR
jgi:hypothetical protein